MVAHPHHGGSRLNLYGVSENGLLMNGEIY